MHVRFMHALSCFRSDARSHARSSHARSWLAAALAVACSSPVLAQKTAVEKVESAASSAATATVRGATQVQKAATKGVKKGAHAVERGASAAGQKVQRTARRLGVPVASQPQASGKETQ